MYESPNEIELDSIEDLADPRVLELVNYLVIGGDVYALRMDGYGDDHYLELVDEIPDEHWERYADE